MLADRIKLAFVYGSIARGAETASSGVDLMVVGDVSFADVASALGQIESKLGWEVNPTVYGQQEFREKLADKNHFLSTVAKEKKLFVIGEAASRRSAACSVSWRDLKDSQAKDLSGDWQFAIAYNAALQAATAALAAAAGYRG